MVRPPLRAHTRLNTAERPRGPSTLSPMARSRAFLGRVLVHRVHVPRLLYSAHVGCFRILATVNNDAMNTGAGIRVSLCSGYIPGNGFAGSNGSSVFNFSAESPCFPRWLLTHSPTDSVPLLLTDTANFLKALSFLLNYKHRKGKDYDPIICYSI